MSGRKPAEESAKAPAWIVTYSDMITLLLTFFVMLQSMADTQVEDHKFKVGQASFVRAIEGFGLAGFSMKNKPDLELEETKATYDIDEGMDKPENRSMDSHTEMLRRIMFEIETKMKISPSQIEGVSKTFLPLKTRFASKSPDLNEEAKKELQLYWNYIHTTTTGQEPILYILGLAADEIDPKLQWNLSAQRAQIVKEYLESLNQTDNKPPIFCWGAGEGGDWIGQSGLTTKQTQIMIVLIIEK
jgi:flagellar motor protein MotB